MKEKYTMKDARKRRELREYAEMILRAAKSAELMSRGVATHNTEGCGSRVLMIERSQK
jgi:hypothetical protein